MTQVLGLTVLRLEQRLGAAQRAPAGVKMRHLFILSLAGLTLAGCATVTRGTTNQVQIVSEPSGALARTSLGHQCSTPCTLQLSRKDEFSVTFAMPGYEEQTIVVKTQIAGAGAAGFAGNVLVGGVIGMGVDAATGSTLEHVPNPVSAVLRPLPRPTPQRSAPRSRSRGSVPQASLAPGASS
jgi:membrane-bound inhibitor of C-type lysozyme